MTDCRRLLTFTMLPELNEPAGFPGDDRAKITTGQRLLYRPASSRLVTLALDDRTLVVRQLDPEALLRRAGIDYLFVASAPSARVSPGQDYADTVDVRSKAAGVRCDLAQGPPGMTVSESGRVTWHAPPTLSPALIPVRITVRNAAGREVEYAWQLIPPGALPKTK